MIERIATTALACLLALGSAAVVADEGKDESGKGKRWREEGHRYETRGDGEGRGSYFHRHGYTRIPNGHLPPPGECRIWYPDRPAGHQPPPFKCGQGHARVEPGGWLLSPGPRPREVQAAVYDVQRPGIVVDIGIFDARTGSMIRVTGTR